MRKFALFIGTLFLFAGCMGGTGTKGLDSNAQITIHKERAFEVGVPTGWVEITREEVPELQKHFVFAYAKPDYIDGFSTNMTVITEDLVQIQDSLKYAKANMVAASRDVLDYQVLDKQSITVSDGEATIDTELHIFEGRYRRTDPLTKYIQMYLVKDYKGYIVTVNIPFDEDNYEKYISSLFSTFRFY